MIWDGQTQYNFEFDYGFIDGQRVEGKDKVVFDGKVTVTPPAPLEIPAYEFGVQALWELIVQSKTKDVLANCSITPGPGQYGNRAIINLYRINEDGTVEQIEEAPPYAEAVALSFFGEGN